MAVQSTAALIHDAAMIVSIHQPAYLPWLGYLDRIATSDTFIFLDNVQFERNSFVNRNRIKTAHGPIWLTVPVKLGGHLHKTILDTEIDDRQDWQRKHLRSIEQSYSGAPDFAAKFARLSAAYHPKTNKLADFCYRQLNLWASEFGIATPIIRASALPICGRKSDLVLNLCQHVKATTYLSGPLGRSYLDEQKFSEAGIRIAYHDFAHPIYPQAHGDFVAAMGVVDYWMNSDKPDLFRGIK